MSITDVLVGCHACGTHAPCGEMTMNDAELWECDDTAACKQRQACLWDPTPKQPMTGAELLAVSEVERLTLRPGDMLVFKSPTRLTDDEFEDLGNRLRAVIPDTTKIIVLEGGADISVLRAV